MRVEASRNAADQAENGCDVDDRGTGTEVGKNSTAHVEHRSEIGVENVGQPSVGDLVHRPVPMGTATSSRNVNDYIEPAEAGRAFGHCPVGVRATTQVTLHPPAAVGRPDVDPADRSAS